MKEFHPMIFSDWLPLVETMTEHERSELLLALLSGEEPTDVPLWPFFKQQLEKQRQHLLEKSEKAKQSAQKRWCECERTRNDANAYNGMRTYANDANGCLTEPNRTEPNQEKEVQEKSASRKSDDVRHSSLVEQVVSAYNQVTSGRFPQVKALTDKRRKAVRKFIDFYRKQVNAVDEQAFLSAVRDYFLKATQSEFLTGKNDRGWKADFDFLTNENKALAFLEGKYDTKQAYHQPTNMFTVVKPSRPANFEDDFDPDFDLDSFGVAK